MRKNNSPWASAIPLFVVFGFACGSARASDTASDLKPDADGYVQSGIAAALTYKANPDFIVRLEGKMDKETSKKIRTKLYELARKDPKQDIILEINSVGGEVQSGWEILDAMNTVPNRVHTLCEYAASTAALVFISNRAGHRFAYPSCTIMNHEPSWESKGNASLMMEKSLGIQQTKDAFIKSIANNSYLNKDQARDLIETGDTEIGAKEAYKFGIVDGILPAQAKIGREVKELYVQDGFCNSERKRRMRALCGEHTLMGTAAPGGNGYGANAPR